MSQEPPPDRLDGRDPACDLARSWMADRIGDHPDEEPPEALARHLLTCARCRSDETRMDEAFAAVAAFAADEAEADFPPTDLAALHRSINRLSRPATTRRLVGRLARVAAVLLAAVGIAALFGTEVRAADGRVAVSFGVPGVERETPASTGAPALESVIDSRVARVFDPSASESPVRRAVHAELRPHLEDLAHWFVDVDRRREEDLEFLASWLDRRRQDDAAMLARQLLETRARLDDTERVQHDLIEVLAPRLDAVRFEPR